jgi:hypothetical protein
MRHSAARRATAQRSVRRGAGGGREATRARTSRHATALAAAARIAAVTPRVRSHCRFAPPSIHFIPDFRCYSVPLVLKRRCDRTLVTPSSSMTARRSSVAAAATCRCSAHSVGGLSKIFIDTLRHQEVWSAKCLNWSTVTRAYVPATDYIGGCPLLRKTMLRGKRLIRPIVTIGR